MAKAAIISEFFRLLIASSMTVHARPTMADVPLIRESPSLAFRYINSIPAASIASLPGISSPLYLAFHSPKPTLAMQPRGPRSPLVPRDPFCGINGQTCLLIIST